MTPVQLEDFLIKHDLSEDDFVEMIGVTRPALRHWFVGRRKIPPTVAKIVRFLNANPQMIAKLHAA